MSPEDKVFDSSSFGAIVCSIMFTIVKPTRDCSQ